MSLTSVAANLDAFKRGSFLRISTEKQEASQTATESGMLSGELTQRCPANVSFTALDRLNGIDSDKVNMTISQQFYDPNLMKSMECLVGSMVYFEAPAYGGAASGDRVKYWIRNLSKLSEGVEGMAFRGNLDDAKDLFAVKVSKNEDLLHEFFMGLQINKLRVKIPNFAYLYAGFNCSNPFVNENLFGWCWKAGVTERLPISTLVYENITPSIPFDKYVTTASFNQWLEKFYQILFGLRTAQQMLDFTHYDLLATNVLIRDLKPITSGNRITAITDTSHFYIPYDTDQGTEYLLTDKVSTIIDYGMSHLKVNNKNFGKWGLSAYGINPEKSRPMFDIYKLLMTSIFYASNAGNTDLSSKAIPLVQFFNTQDDIQAILNGELQTSYSLREDPSIDALTIDDFLKFLRSQYDVSGFLHSNPTRGIRVLGCTGTDICTIQPYDYSTIGFSDQLKINDLFAFYDLHKRWINENYDSQARELLMSFQSKYQQAIGPRLKDLILQTEPIQAEINSFSFKSIQGSPIEALGNDETLINTYQAQIIKYLQLYDLYQGLRLLVTVIVYAVNLYDDQNTLNYVQGKHTIIVKLGQYLKNNYQANFLNDAQYIADLSSHSPDFMQMPLYNKWTSLDQVVSNTPIQ